MRSGIAVAVGLAVAALLSAPGALRSDDLPYHVGTGDLLHITIYAGGDKQDEFDVEVGMDGTISCPLAGQVRLEGMAAPGIASKLRGILARDFYVDPDVLVSVKEYGGRIYVLGEVKNAGVYSLKVAPTALSACVLAGGFTNFAAPRHGKVTRLLDGKPKVIGIDLVKAGQGRGEDLALLAGDRIEVPRRRF